MRRSTGIELGPDSCVLVAARQGGATTDVSVLHLLEGADWPSHDVAITSTLKDLRRARRLPRRAAVVVWGLPDDAASQEPSTRAAVGPVVAAGFNVRHVMTPPQALAALAATRPDIDPDAAVAWMALNTYGVALAIVRRGELLFSRTFDWPYRTGVESSKGQLLQRYALVAHLAPELQRGIASVQTDWGAHVERAVTCGNLPELRSLTMPLIEELDLEVETLDSIEGLRPVGRAKADRFAESAPAIRLAAAAAVAVPPRVTRSLSPVVRAAAVLALAAGIGWVAWAAYRAEQDQAAARVTPPVVSAARDPLPSAPPPVRPGTEPVRSMPPPAPVETAPVPAVPPKVTPGQEIIPPPSPTRPPVATGTPPVKDLQLVKPPTPAVPPVSPPAKARPPTDPPATPPLPTTPAPPLKSQAQPPKIEEVGPLPLPPPAPPPTHSARPPAPLKDPLPRVESILIDHNRRLAIIDGRIVTVGDSVGARVVVRIEAGTVVLREPSGLDVSVPLRGGRGTTGL
jgi:hypothetical protein